MADARFRMTNGHHHAGMAAAVHDAERMLAGALTHTCDLVVPLDSLTAEGHWVCLGCLYEEAWRHGYGAGLADGKEAPTCPRCDGYVPGSGVAGYQRSHPCRRAKIP
jgi:hypothetical protein